MSEEFSQTMADSFGYLFILSRRFEYITDKILRRDGLTTKQLLVLMAIGHGFTSPPSVSEVAELLSTSHQNVKAIANNLEKRGFVKMIRDEKDKRRWLLILTPRNQEYWDSRFPEHSAAMFSLFKSLSPSEIQQLHGLVVKLIEGTEEVYEQAREKISLE
ncbi:MAG: MarR family winged helix-turn-helix transcriptional regulator [Promethearchaeota archaeon]